MKQLTILLLFITNLCYSQTNEVVGSNVFGYRLGSTVEGTYNVIRTDEDGKVVWVKPVINDNTIPFDLTDNQYIIYGFTNVKNGKITSKASDYDYWLVRSDLDCDVAIYPNPSPGTFYVSLSNYREGMGINLYDITHKLVFNSQINQYINFFHLPNISNGTYIYEILNGDELLKTGKLCVLQNF